MQASWPRRPPVQIINISISSLRPTGVGSIPWRSLVRPGLFGEPVTPSRAHEVPCCGGGCGVQGLPGQRLVPATRTDRNSDGLSDRFIHKPCSANAKAVLWRCVPLHLCGRTREIANAIVFFLASKQVRPFKPHKVRCFHRLGGNSADIDW